MSLPKTVGRSESWKVDLDERAAASQKQTRQGMARRWLAGGQLSDLAAAHGFSVEQARVHVAFGLLDLGEVSVSDLHAHGYLKAAPNLATDRDALTPEERVEMERSPDARARRHKS